MSDSVGRRTDLRPVHPSRFSFSQILISQFEPKLEKENAGGSPTSTTSLASPPNKGQTVGKHPLRDQFPAFRCGKGRFGDNSSRRWMDGFGPRDRRLFDHCGDNDVRNCHFIRFDGNGDLSTGTEPVDSRLSGILLILSFDKGSLRHEKKWHMFPRSIFTADLIRKGGAVKVQRHLCGRIGHKKGARPVRGAPSSVSRDNVKRRGDCSEQDIVSSGSDAQILVTKSDFKSRFRM
ncbi:hypothetical protein ACQEDT_21390 [Agrobacterium pusense]